MGDRLQNALLCVSCGVEQILELRNIIIASNSGTFKMTIVLEWTCEQCKTVNHFACYGKYVPIRL